MAKLDGKVALITGAAAGLGEGIASAYAKYGAKMILVDLSPAVEETAEKLRREYGAEVITAVANVADRAQMDAAAAKAVEAFGAIHIACCNISNSCLRILRIGFHSHLFYHRCPRISQLRTVYTDIPSCIFDSQTFGQSNQRRLCHGISGLSGICHDISCYRGCDDNTAASLL